MNRKYVKDDVVAENVPMFIADLRGHVVHDVTVIEEYERQVMLEYNSEGKTVMDIRGKREYPWMFYHDRANAVEHVKRVLEMDVKDAKGKLGEAESRLRKFRDAEVLPKMGIEVL